LQKKKKQYGRHDAHFGDGFVVAKVEKKSIRTNLDDYAACYPQILRFIHRKRG